ncbi:Egg cell-secreted protein 1.4 [Raphanus sativus]|nr:Egg cell-secreted protein 1.4 [Raphanus sativus]
MASNTAFLLASVALLGVILLQNTTVSGRDIPRTESTNIAARLQSGGIMECWNALYELKSCTNEIVLFFLNGETKLGVSCCEAVDVITNSCWPALRCSLLSALHQKKQMSSVAFARIQTLAALPRLLLPIKLDCDLLPY